MSECPEALNKATTYRFEHIIARDAPACLESIRFSGRGGASVLCAIAEKIIPIMTHIVRRGIGIERKFPCRYKRNAMIQGLTATSACTRTCSTVSCPKGKKYSQLILCCYKFRTYFCLFKQAMSKCHKSCLVHTKTEKIWQASKDIDPKWTNRRYWRRLLLLLKFNNFAICCCWKRFVI